MNTGSPVSADGVNYIQFWTDLARELHKLSILTFPTEEPSGEPWKRNWFPLPVPGQPYRWRDRTYFAAAFKSTGELVFELAIEDRGETSGLRFAALRAVKEQIEEQFGELQWDEVPGRQKRMIMLRSGLFKDQQSPEELQHWLIEHAPRFIAVFTYHLQALMEATN